MSTKAAVMKSDGHNKHHMSGDAASKHTASNTELEFEIEIIPDMSDTMTAIEKKGESALLSGSKPDLFLDQLRANVTGIIIVMISWVWDVSVVSGRYLSTDFVVSDAKGQMIHCSALASVAHNFLHLKEGGIYSVKIFVVKPNKEEYQVIKDDNFMLEFNGSTTFRKVFVKADGFVRYPLKLVDLDAIEPADNKYLIDVVGYVSNIGRTNHLKSGSKNLDFHLANHRAVNQSNAMGKPRRDKVYLSSTSSTMILDDVEIPAIKALKDANRQRYSATFHYTMTIDGVRTKTGWNFPLWGSEDYKKSVTRQKGYFYCESFNRQVDFPMLRYRLELDVSNNTAQTVIVMFDETATALVGCLVGLLVDIEDEVFVCDMFNRIENIFVGIKSLLNVVSITAALIDVNVVQSKLVLLENFNENYSKCLRLLYKVNAAEGVNAASEEVRTAELVSTAYVIYMRYFELVALRNFARRHGSRFYTHGGCIQSSHAQTRRSEVKARGTLMMGIPNKHPLKLNSIKDAKLLLEAVEKRFGGNAGTKKTQRNLLKQQYENFTAPSSEMLDQIFDRLQNPVSQLELLDEKLSQEDVN
ncbi:replication protein A 70 kDa DNA-binding subunit C-like protein [Tanacetum coccineum]|uniref:Replication protein A 70 kDa DNA-binding subunit C-like protein n=1 Tax=Tanacetum coccineum TaxID=301880 RepID=A0ABQ5GQJ1_9ASTR